MKKVTFNFINKKGIQKQAFVLVDDETYIMINKLSESDKINYLSDLYHENMRERNYQRHILHSDNYFGEDEDLELPDNSVDKEDVETKMQVDEILSKLNANDRKIIEDYYLKNLSQKEIALNLNISQMAVSKRIKSVLEKLKNSL